MIERCRLLALVVILSVAACGGGDDGTTQVFMVTSGEAPEIADTISPADLLGLDVQHRIQLTAVGVTVESSICHISTDVVVGFPSILFVYVIQVEHVPAAIAAGFASERPRGFLSPSRPCLNAPVIYPA